MPTQEIVTITAAQSDWERLIIVLFVAIVLFVWFRFFYRMKIIRDDVGLLKKINQDQQHQIDELKRELEQMKNERSLK